MQDILPSFTGLFGRQSLPVASRDDDADDEALDVPEDTMDRKLESKREVAYEGSTQSRRYGRIRRSPRAENDKSDVASSSPSSPSDARERAVIGLGIESLRCSRLQSEQASKRILNDILYSDSESRKHAEGEEGGVSLKPLTPLSPAREQQIKKPTVARKRSANIANIDAGRVNELSKEENEWMTEDPVIRNYARISQEGLYGAFGVDDMAYTPMLQRYLQPSRDTDEIRRHLRDMTVNDHNYGIGGPPNPADIYNIDYHTDVSDVRGHTEFEEARKAKAFAGYVMFSDRQEEISMLQRMQEKGYLKDDVDIQYGYQEIGPHGSVAWLTYEGQEIGGRQREEYEREKAHAGKLRSFVFVQCGRRRVAAVKSLVELVPADLPCAATLATPRLLRAPAATSLLHVLTSSSSQKHTSKPAPKPNTRSGASKRNVATVTSLFHLSTLTIRMHDPRTAHLAPPRPSRN